MNDVGRPILWTCPNAHSKSHDGQRRAPTRKRSCSVLDRVSARDPQYVIADFVQDQPKTSVSFELSCAPPLGEDIATLPRCDWWRRVAAFFVVRVGSLVLHDCVYFSHPSQSHH